MKIFNIHSIYRMIVLLFFVGSGTVFTNDLSQDLVKAVEKGDIKTVERLLQQGADANTMDEHGDAILYKAAHNGHIEIARLLLKNKANVDIKQPGSLHTPLIRTAQKGDIDMMKLFIQYGANVNAKTNRGQTALFKAAMRTSIYDKPDTLKLLVQHGANVNFKDNSGQTALGLALFNSNMDTVKILIQNGADVNVRNNNGLTPLHMAIGTRKEDLPIAKYLVKHGAKVNVKNKKGKTPLDYTSVDTDLSRIRKLKS